MAKAIDFSVLPTINEYIKFSFGAAIALILIFALGNLYTLKKYIKFSEEIKKVSILIVIWIALIITYYFFTRTFPFSRLAIIYSWIFSLVLVLTGRGLIKFLQIFALKMGVGRSRIIFIGNNNISSELAEQLSKEPRYKILGVIGDAKKENNVKTLGRMSQLEYILKHNKIDEIIQTESGLQDIENENIIEFCDLRHISYKFVPDLLEVRRTNVAVETIGTIPVISIKPTPLEGWGKVVKRAADVTGSLLGMIILSPVFLTTAIAIKIDSNGPILLTKLDDGSPVKRVGQYGKLFKFYKFRSMNPNTDKLRYTELAEKNIRNDGPLIKIKDDPRITPVGRFIRKYSIDELPQFWNIFIGNLSIVGPRPHLPEEVAKYKKHHKFVLTLKPGLTGLAQISGRSDLDFEKEVKLDRYYIENWSIWLDIKTIIKTLGVILKGYKE